jgi:integrase-like protein
MGLHWPQVDLANQQIRLLYTKNDEPRSVPLQGLALDLMRKRAKVRAIHTDLVFPGKQLGSCRNLQHLWRQALESAGVEDFRWHDLRHSAASYLAMNGATPPRDCRHPGASNFGHGQAIRTPISRAPTVGCQQDDTADLRKVSPPGSRKPPQAIPELAGRPANTQRLDVPESIWPDADSPPDNTASLLIVAAEKAAGKNQRDLMFGFILTAVDAANLSESMVKSAASRPGMLKRVRAARSQADKLRRQLNTLRTAWGPTKEPIESWQGYAKLPRVIARLEEPLVGAILGLEVVIAGLTGRAGAPKNVFLSALACQLVIYFQRVTGCPARAGEGSKLNNLICDVHDIVRPKPTSPTTVATHIRTSLDRLSPGNRP